MTSVERTAYPIFPKLVLARELHVFFTPSPDEMAWAREKTDTGEHLLALTLALKCFQKMGRFPKSAEVPECQGTSGLPCGRTSDLLADGQVMSVRADS